MLGDRYFGLRGAMAALAGMLTVPLLVVLVLALLYAQFAGNPQVAGALRGMGAVAAGLIAATGLKLIAALQQASAGLRASAWARRAGASSPSRWLRMPLGWVLLVLGGAACVLDLAEARAMSHRRCSWHDWLALFVQYLMLSLLSVGGAITTAPDMHRYLVDQHAG